MPISCPSTPEARNAAVGSSYLHCTMLTGQVQWKTNIPVQGGHKIAWQQQKDLSFTGTYTVHRVEYKHRANKSLLNTAELQSG